MKHPILTFICLFFLCANVQAQDTIFMRSGEKIIAKILELNTREVKYKKFDFQDGPQYVVAKLEVLKIVYLNGMTENFLDKSVTPQTNDYSKPNNTVSPATNTAKKNPMDNPIEMIGNRYYLNYYLPISEVNRILLAKKNNEITAMVMATKKEMVPYYVLAYAPIPLGVAGYVLLNLAVNNSNSNSNYNTYTLPVNTDLLAGALVFAAAAVATRVIATKKKRKINLHRRKAVELYNATYYRNGKQ
jgi:hypothetical protein